MSSNFGLPQGWTNSSIDELKADSKAAIAIGPFGSRMKSDCYVDSGIPVIRGTNLTGGRAFQGEFVYITKEKADKLGGANVYKDDLVFPHRGAIGEVGIISEDSRFILSSSLMKLTCKKEKADPLFLYYFFKSSLGRHELLKNASQVGTPGIGQPLSSLKGIRLNLPTINEQREIAKILGSLDDKIELNRQINQTLEQIAQAIFKSWFVDFEPVKAKIKAKQEWDKRPTAMDGGSDENAGAIFVERAAMRAISGKTDEELDVQGRTNAAGAGSAGAADALGSDWYKQLKEIAALFPDEFEDDAQGSASAAGGRTPGAASELGGVPRGWEIKPLSKMIELIGGGTPKRSEDAYWSGDIPWFSVKDAPADGDVFVIDTEEKITELGLNKSSTKLLPEGVTIISARGTVGRLALVGVPMAMNQSCYGVKGVDDIGPVFNYFNLKRAISTLKQQTHGAVFDTITTKTFDSVYSVSPCEKSLVEFERIVTPLLERIKSNLSENESLIGCRDSLLPKLLSGEITLDDANSAAEAVA